MAALTYIRLIGFSAGTLLNLFLLALILGHRRRRKFERVLFFLLLAMFLFYAGGLLALNAVIHYSEPPWGTLVFAMGLAGLGLAFLPPLVVHSHTAYEELATGRATGLAGKMLAAGFYLPAVYFGFEFFLRALGGITLESLWPRSLGGIFYGAWLGAALLVSAVFELRAARTTAGLPQQGMHRWLVVYCAAAGSGVVLAYSFVWPRNALGAEWFATAIMFSGILPCALVGYYALRRNFLEFGLQRSLVFALSAAFLALLYLSVARRAGIWLEPILPPEATAAILLFVLVVFFEPLQRLIGPALYRSFHARMDRLQKLMMELQREAQEGDLARLVGFSERRMREEFGLAEARILLTQDGKIEEARRFKGQVNAMAIPLRSGRETVGVLRVQSAGAFMTGDTAGALEYLAEQLPGTVHLCRLIEEKVKLERQLAERERLALVGQVAASISHNLRNPLSSMKTVLQVQIENPKISDDLRKDCQLVLGEIDRLARKLTQLLEYARTPVRSAGGISGQAGVAAAGTIERTVALLRYDAERRGVNIELKRPAEDSQVRATEEGLSEVISNLVVNAIEALPQGGLVSIALERRDARFVIEVTDDGPGIPAEMRARIFEPFYTTKPSGTGLGLAIVARRVAEAEGTITCESPASGGKGTRFVVSFPVEERSRLE
ncbi:MAG: two-component system sensor histidine kinase NtrB [Candidatus Acidiferrales bacterium]